MELYSTAVGGAPEQRKTKQQYYALCLHFKVQSASQHASDITGHRKEHLKPVVKLKEATYIHLNDTKSNHLTLEGCRDLAALQTRIRAQDALCRLRIAAQRACAELWGY